MSPALASNGAAIAARAELEQATELHPHARVVLAGALEQGNPSHAYLFHGPRGVGKIAAARAFAAGLLAAGSVDERDAVDRAMRGSHPDLTWVAPSGAHEMRIDDIAEPVVKQATRTPMESLRRVFVLERVDTMSAEVANRMLKTLEEPGDYVHFILLTSAPERVLPTVVSRCQSVRFDAIPPRRIAELLVAEGVDADRAASCAALAEGDLVLARELASEDGETMRSAAGRIVACALRGVSGRDRPWRDVLTRAEAAGEAAEQELLVATEQRLEVLPKGRERSAAQKEGEQSAHRAARRVRSESLDRSLSVAALLMRDLAAAAGGSADLVLAKDRASVIEKASAGRPVGRLLEAAEEIDETRRHLRRNVSEELTLQALSFRLDKILNAG
ncbi:MAG TPA: AAA family ATPase [Solirubrobacterales bacterium]|nr:AAA family ATPase [Solirubrobacterales bacterium]